MEDPVKILEHSGDNLSGEMITTNMRFSAFATVLDGVRNAIHIKQEAIVWIIDIQKNCVSSHVIVMGYADNVPYVSHVCDGIPVYWEYTEIDGKPSVALLDRSIERILEQQYYDDNRIPDSIILRTDMDSYASDSELRVMDNVVYNVARETVALRVIQESGLFWNKYAIGIIKAENVVGVIRNLFGGFLGKLCIIDISSVRLLLHIMSGLSLSVDSIVSLINAKENFKIVGKTSLNRAGVWFWHKDTDTSDPQDQLGYIKPAADLSEIEVKSIEVAPLVAACESNNSDLSFGNISLQMLLEDIRNKYSRLIMIDDSREVLIVSALLLGNEANSIVLRRIYSICNGKISLKQDVEFRHLYISDLIAHRGILHGVKNGARPSVLICCISSVGVPSISWDSVERRMTADIPIEGIYNGSSVNRISLDLYDTASAMCRNGLLVLGDEAMFSIIDNMSN